MGRDETIKEVAKQVTALLPLVEAAVSDNFTAEDRAKVRELCGCDDVFILANRLHWLCGETARKIEMEKSIPGIKLRKAVREKALARKSAS